MSEKYLTTDYDFNVPIESIALYPRENPEKTPLLCVNNQDKTYKNCQFQDLLTLLKFGSILVINDTKVEKRRFFAKTLQDKTFEVLLLSQIAFRAQCKIRRSRKLSINEPLYLTSSLYFTILEKQKDGILDIQFHGSPEELQNFFDSVAQLPLPPYILKYRPYEKQDEQDYQTVFAKHTGSAASPTAGLHFTKTFVEKLKSSGITIVPVELYVSLGTFHPIQTEYIHEHPMHTEEYYISEESSQILNRAKQEGKKIIAVGTTSLRTLESAWNKDTQQFSPGKGKTNLFISPGYQIQSINGLITNFHTPTSTLFVLICTLIGYHFAKECYQYALEHDYRFFSYGDAMYIENIVPSTSPGLYDKDSKIL